MLSLLITPGNDLTLIFLKPSNEEPPEKNLYLPSSAIESLDSLSSPRMHTPSVGLCSYNVPERSFSRVLLNRSLTRFFICLNKLYLYEHL